MTPPSNHPDAGDLARDELLSAYLDGAVTAKQRAEVEALLAEDAGARAVLAQLREVAEAVRHLPTETAPSHIHQDVTARLERETLLAGMDQDVTLARHRRPHWRATLMIAAMVAIAIGGGMYVSLQLAPPAKTGPAVVLDDGSRGGERAPVPDLRDSELLDDLRKLKEASRANGEGAPPATVLPDWAREKSDPQDAGETAAVEPLAAKSAPNDIAASPSRGAPAAAAPTHRVEEANDLIAETTGDMFAELGNTTSTTPASSDRAERARSRQGKSSPARGAGSAIAPMRPVFDSDILARRDLTLEQRLRRGEAQSIAKTHPFAEEPLRLVVRFSDPLVLASHVQHISGMLAERGAPNLDTAPPARQSLVRRSIRAAHTPAQQPFFLEGRRGVNFTSDAAIDRCILARVQPQTLIDVVDEFGAGESTSVELRLGEWRASGQAAARALAVRLEAPRSPAAVTRPGSSPTGISRWLSALGELLNPPGASAGRGGRTDADSNGIDMPAGLASRPPDESAPLEPLITAVIELRIDESPDAPAATVVPQGESRTGLPGP
jgi:hypothetical protein